MEGFILFLIIVIFFPIAIWVIDCRIVKYMDQEKERHEELISVLERIEVRLDELKQ